MNTSREKTDTQVISNINNVASSFGSQDIFTLIAIFVTSLIYYLSYASYGYSESDWGGIVIAAERFLLGDTFYKDISIVYTPGIYLYTALAFKIFGVKLWSATAAWGLIRAVNCLLIYLLGTKFFSRKLSLMLPFILWIIPGPPHKSFLVFFCLLHLILFIRHLSSNNKSLYLFSGIVAGISFIFRLDLLLSFIITLSLVDLLKLLHPIHGITHKSQIMTSLKNYPIFASGLVLAILPLALYLDSNSALAAAVNQTLYFVGSARSRMFLLPPVSNFTSWSIWDFSNYAVIYIPIGIFTLLLIEIFNNIKSGRYGQDGKKLLILFLYGTLSLHQILRWPWTGRLFQILPPFIIADMYILMKLYINRHKEHIQKPRFIYTALFVITNSVLILMILGSLTMSDMYTNGSILIRFTNTTSLSTPKASFYTTREEAFHIHKIIDVIEAETTKDEFIYIIQYYPMYYFITGRRNATKYYFLEAYVYSEEKQRDVVKQLEDKKVKFIISGPNHPETPEATVLNEYLNEHFKIIETVGKKIIYKKIESPITSGAST